MENSKAPKKLNASAHNMTGNQECTLSTNEASSRPSTEVIALGKKLSDELALDRSCETLSKWVAHLLAEKIVAIESAEDADEKQSLEQQAIGLTLQIWKQRYCAPPCIQPFGRLEKAVEFLAALQGQETDPLSAFLAKRSEVSPWHRLANAVEAFRIQAVPLLALTQVVLEVGDNPLEWEEENREMLEAAEVDATTLFRHWRMSLDETSDREPDETSATQETENDNANKATLKIEECLDKLQDAFAQFKAEVL